MAEVVGIQDSKKQRNKFDKWSAVRRGLEPKKRDLFDSTYDIGSLPKICVNVDATGLIETGSSRLTKLGTHCVDFTTDAVTIPPRVGRRLAHVLFFDNLVGWF